MSKRRLSRTIDRTLTVLLTCVPMCMGVLAFVNNISDWNGTLSHVVTPLLTLDALRDVPQFRWRALPGAAAPFVYLGVTSVELIVGLSAGFAVTAMLRRFGGSTTAFSEACQIAQRSCTLGIITWLFFFFVVAGDWFLAWRNPSLVGVQRDALMYAGAAAFVLIGLRSAEVRLLSAEQTAGSIE
jgi:predicted small integral membrane protein